MCGNCSSYDLSRTPGGSTHGPMDRCKRCGHSFPAKPGTLTADQMTGKPDEAMAMSADSPYVLNTEATGEGTAVPLALEGYPTIDDAGNPIHYRKMMIAKAGSWIHCGTGEPLEITHKRIDGWIDGTAKISAAGRKPFVPTKHTFSNPSAADNLGNVVKLERDGDNLYATVGFHGDEALSIAARNGRSIGVSRNALDAKGNKYDEVLHHLAIVPNPALPDLGGMMKIAASADGAVIDVPVYELPKKTNPKAAPDRRSFRMSPENAEKARKALALGADVTDAQIDDAVALKAIALSADVATITTARDDFKTKLEAAISERDAAKADADKQSKAVLALSADAPKRPDGVLLAMYADNVAAKRETAVKMGAITEADAKRFDSMLADGKGMPNTLALSACADSGRPFAFDFWDNITKLGTPLRAGTQLSPDSTPAQRAIAASGDGTQDETLTEARRKELLGSIGLEPAKK